MLYKFEESSFENNTTGQRALVLADPNQQALKESIQAVGDKTSNPFQDIGLWVKGERYDLLSAVEAVSQRDAMEGARTRTESKLKSDRASLERLNAGKNTFKTMFKSQTGKQEEATKLTNAIS